jgi:hypothetical protein
MQSRLRAALTAAGIALLVAPGFASASQLIDRNATGVLLQVASDGKALLTYKAGGKLKHVLAWGALNALSPNPSRPQVAFKLDYSGGWGSSRKLVWKSFKNTCTPLKQQVVAWQVTACQATDGSYWAVQSWQRQLPDYGVKPTAQQAVWELRLSHWSGDVAKLSVQTDWAYNRFDHLFGQMSYNGQPVFGFRSSPTGVPLDTYGRNAYLDTFNSAYGPGWQRENSFLLHNPAGTFCYGLYQHGSRPVGKGEQYRITVIGPGVTPDISWTGMSPGPFDATRQTDAAGLERALMANDKLCKPH